MTIAHVFSNNSPQPMGTYSHAVKANGFLFLSGQLPVLPNTNELVSEDHIAQIKQCFDNIKSICESAGTKMENAVKINVYYTDVAVSDNINNVMEQYFSAPYPARIRVKVAGLSKNAKVEIDGVFLCKE